MRRQSRLNATPHFGVQSPAVQQHKIAFALTYCLPVQRCHWLLSFHAYPSRRLYAINPQPLLAMPTAVEPDASWHLQLLPAPSAGPPAVLPALRIARRGDANHLRSLPATAAALAAAGVRRRLRFALSQLVKRFKFHRAPELAPTLARLMLLRWQQARREQNLNRPDLILAVPLHATRCWHRGYNQSDLLARPLALAGLCLSARRFAPGAQDSPATAAERRSAQAQFAARFHLHGAGRRPAYRPGG